jgi:hypothetical protein
VGEAVVVVVVVVVFVVVVVLPTFCFALCVAFISLLFDSPMLLPVLT